MKKYSIEQSGRSMIEMLGVLAIVGVLSVAGIAGYSKAMGKFKINKAMDQVSTLSANIKTMYANIGTYASLKDQEAFNLALFPDEMVKSCKNGKATKCVRSGINGLAKVAGSKDGNDFTIELQGVSKEACAAFVTSEWGGASGFKGLAITGSAEINVTPASTATELFTGAASCSTCATADCTATWTFY